MTDSLNDEMPGRWHPCTTPGGCDWLDHGGVWFEYWRCGTHLDPDGWVVGALDAGDPNPCTEEK